MGISQSSTYCCSLLCLYIFYPSLSLSPTLSLSLSFSCCGHTKTLAFIHMCLLSLPSTHPLSLTLLYASMLQISFHSVRGCVYVCALVSPLGLCIRPSAANIDVDAGDGVGACANLLWFLLSFHKADGFHEVSRAQWKCNCIFRVMATINSHALSLLLL